MLEVTLRKGEWIIMIISNGDIRSGVLGRERSIFTNILGKSYPKPVLDYAKSVSNLTNVPLEKVLESKPIQNYAKRFKYL